MKLSKGNLNFSLEGFFGNGTHQTFIPARTIDYLPQNSAYSTVKKGKAEEFQTNNTMGFNLGLKYKNIYIFKHHQNNP